MISYSLRHKSSGMLALVHSLPVGDERYSREFHLALSVDDNDYSQFLVDTAEKAARVLALDTPMCRTTPETPCWRDLDMGEFDVVKIETTTVVTPIEVEKPVKFSRPIESRKTAPMIAKNYLGRPMPDNLTGELRMNLVTMPDGETKETLIEKCEGKSIIVGPHATTFTLCVGVFETPEEYIDLFKGTPSIGIITSGMLPY